MLVRTTAISVAALAAGLLVLFTPPARALTMKECSAKYQAAKTSGTLSGQSWNDFRKTQCGANAAVAPVATAARTNWRSFRERTLARIIRAFAGQIVIPTTRISKLTLLPKIATTITRRKKAGIMRTISNERERT